MKGQNLWGGDVQKPDKRTGFRRRQKHRCRQHGDMEDTWHVLIRRLLFLREA